MRILLTGAAGMIGNELCHQLAAKGHYLIGNDDLSHNCVELKSLPLNRTFTCRVEQLSLFSIAIGEIDLIIHCASPVGHARLVPEAQVAWSIIKDTQAMLELAEMKGCRLITFSSSEVLTYRGETDIRAQYALGKLASEAMVLGHPKVDVRIIRPYNVTGRLQRADGGFVMARFRDAALKGEPLTIFGSGEQVRHFTHVSDFARFVLLLAEKWPEQKKWSVFNPMNRITISDLAKLFRTDSYPEVIYSSGKVRLSNLYWRDTPDRPLELEQYDECMDLGWTPSITLQRIIEDHMTVPVEAAGA